MGKRVGILTISATDLSHAHLKAAKIPVGTPIEGLETGQEFARVILNNEPLMDYRKARQDHLDAAARLVERHKNIGAIVLECTNMGPFAAEIRKLTGLPVYSINSLITWFQAGLAPHTYQFELDDPRFSAPYPPDS